MPGRGGVTTHSLMAYLLFVAPFGCRVWSCRRRCRLHLTVFSYEYKSRGLLTPLLFMPPSGACRKPAVDHLTVVFLNIAFSRWTKQQRRPRVRAKGLMPVNKENLSIKHNHVDSSSNYIERALVSLSHYIYIFLRGTIWIVENSELPFISLCRHFW